MLQYIQFRVLTENTQFLNLKIKNIYLAKSHSNMSNILYFGQKYLYVHI